MCRICHLRTQLQVRIVDLELKFSFDTSSGLHATPAGQYPERGPKPSKFGVLFYLLSIMFCCIGIIIICRFPFIEVGH